MAKAAPAFQFYPDEFDTGTALMTLSEVGGYIRLLNFQWHHGSVPGDNQKSLSQIMRCTKNTAQSVWAAISHKFDKMSENVWQNARLERERVKQAEFRQRQSDRGRESAARRNPGSTEPQPSLNQDPVAIRLQPEGNSPSPSPSPSPRDQIKERSDLVQTRATGFDDFWAAYPNKTGKLAARKIWDRLKPVAELQQRMAATLERLKRSPQWLKDGGQFIPLPTTWLNQGRWDDEPIDIPQVSEKSARSLGAIYGND